MSNWKELKAERTWIVTSETNEPGSPFVVLFGWTGGSRKNVGKYTDYWLKKGYTCLVHLAVYDAAIFRGGPMDDVDELVHWCKENIKSKDTVVIMSFSNGGAHQVDRFLKMVMNWVPKAWILDSSPAQMTSRNIKSFGEFLIPALGFKTRTWVSMSAGYSMAVVLTMLFTLVGSWRFLLGYLKTGSAEGAKKWVRDVYGKNFRDSVQGAVHWPAWKDVPRLFLFSDADLMIPREGPIEAARLLQDKSKSMIQLKEFKKSDHVKHAVDYPDEYWSTVDAFLARC
jgi:hypothetical protein